MLDCVNTRNNQNTRIFNYKIIFAEIAGPVMENNGYNALL